MPIQEYITYEYTVFCDFCSNYFELDWETQDQATDKELVKYAESVNFKFSDGKWVCEECQKNHSEETDDKGIIRIK
jgi:hypothetical protein